jgi:DNA-binding NarL/FixJ family response regulator
MRKLRILLADDHQMIREGLKAILNSEPDMEVVAEADDGATAVTAAAACHPDVVVMDVSMPKLSGIKATTAIKGSSPDAKVLALTRHAEGAYLQELLKAGASGYVLKQSRASELPHAIRSVATGGTYIDPGIAGKVLTPAGRQARTRGAQQYSALSAREEEVIRLVACGYANKEIANRLTLSVKTVETHKANAMQKLGLVSRLELVRFAMLQGWLDDA